MRVVLAVHGYPPEESGGTEQHVETLAHALANAGHAAVVVAGTARKTLETGLDRTASDSNDPGDSNQTDRELGASVRVLRIARSDLYADHWQKSLSSPVGERFRAILRAERPDVVHVHHWMRLSRDLVRVAAEERVPAVVTLHDAWTSCLVPSRVRPDTGTACDAVLGPMPCLTCAQRVPPKTPWVPLESQFMALAERERDLLSELALARAVIVPTRAHGEALARGFGGRLDEIRMIVIPPTVSAASGTVDAWRMSRAAPRSAGPLVIGAWEPLSRWNGADLILEALHDPRLAANVELHLAGPFSDARFESRVRALAHGIDVHFHEPLRAADGRARHPAVGVHVFVGATRVCEAYGHALDEARTLGLPSVLPRHPAFVERTDEARGTLFFEPGDPRDLARVIARLLDESDLSARLAAGVPTLERSDPSQALLPIYERAVVAGAPVIPSAGPAGDPWFKARMQAFAEQEWDRSVSQMRAADLGLDGEPVAQP